MAETKIRNFKDLKIWQEGIGLVTDIYRVSQEFPRTEAFGLCTQMRRCAVSIPSNVAEGFNRYHPKYVHFLYIALGSCSELETQLEISLRLNLIADDVKIRLVHKLIEITKMTRSLIRKIEEKA